MISESPPWHPFHPERGAIPPELRLTPSEGRVVLLSSLNHATEGRWSARAAVRLAREWAAEGSRVFLADLGFDHPELHLVLGEENGEGMTDTLLYGASIQRIARPVGERFFFAPAGTISADSGELLGHAGWREIIDGFLAAGVTLVLYCPAKDARAAHGSEGAFSRATCRVVLTGAGSSPEDLRDEGGLPLLAVLAPGSAPENGGGYEARGAVAPADAAPDAPVGAPVGAPPREEHQRPPPFGEGDSASASAPETAEGGGGASEGEGRQQGPSAPPLEEPYVRKSRTKEKPRRTLRPWLMLILLLLVGGVLAAAWLGFVDVPGITPAPSEESASAAHPAGGADASEFPQSSGPKLDVNIG